jgi:hypothetical protein
MGLMVWHWPMGSRKARVPAGVGKGSMRFGPGQLVDPGGALVFLCEPLGQDLERLHLQLLSRHLHGRPGAATRIAGRSTPPGLAPTSSRAGRSRPFTKGHVANGHSRKGANKRAEPWTHASLVLLGHGTGEPGRSTLTVPDKLRLKRQRSDQVP